MLDATLAGIVVLVLAAVLLALGAFAVILPLRRLPRPSRLLLGLVFMQAGAVLCLAILAALVDQQSVGTMDPMAYHWLPTALDLVRPGLVDSLRALGLAVTVVGAMLCLVTLAALASFRASGHPLSSNELVQLSEQEWRDAVGEPLEASAASGQQR